MYLYEFLKKLHIEEPGAQYRIQFGGEILTLTIVRVFEDGILCKNGKMYRLFPLPSTTIEPMKNGERYPELVEKVLSGMQ